MITRLKDDGFWSFLDIGACCGDGSNLVLPKPVAMAICPSYAMGHSLPPQDNPAFPMT
jgi:hypothetical protein